MHREHEATDEGEAEGGVGCRDLPVGWEKYPESLPCQPEKKSRSQAENVPVDFRMIQTNPAYGKFR